MNPAKLDAFALRLFTELLAAMSALNIYLGHRLGLFQAMAEGRQVTPRDLAARTGYADRYVREWLECMAVCEYVDYDPVTDRFSLPAEHAVVLLDNDHPKYAAAFFCFGPSFARILPSLMEAFRSGGGVPYEAYGEDAREAIGMGNRPMFVNEYVTRWIPAMPDIERRLRAGGRVAELGCGVGWSSICLAKGFPKVRIDAVDADAASVQQAYDNIRAAGVADRITLHRAPAEEAPLTGPYDLVTAFECLHDMAYPVRALRRMRELASPDGAVLVAGEAAGESLGENRNFLGRLNYNVSVLYSLPQAMVHPGSAGTGTMLRPSTLRRHAEEAGFSRVEVLALETRHWRFYRLTP
jgi:2-polyprenyl-3-methyl-5-hydroxy-6-metoxy-1,4-benzoquinol methylase